MESKPGLTGYSLCYVFDTRYRMALAIHELQDLLHFDEGSANSVLLIVSEQQRASRAAGFDDVSRICEGIQDRLAEVHMQERPLSRPLVVNLLSYCARIKRHSESLADGTVPSV